MRIGTNLSSLQALRALGGAHRAVSGSLTKLSSGSRITRAADDAAGLAIANTLHARARGLSVAQRNIEEGKSILSIAEGGVSSIQELIVRAKELAVRAGSESSATQRLTLDQEFRSLVESIDALAHGTRYQGMPLLDGSRQEPGTLNYVAVDYTASSIDDVLSVSDPSGNGANDPLVSTIVISGAQQGSWQYSSYSPGGGVHELTLQNGGVSQTLVLDLNQIGPGSWIDFDELGIRIRLGEDFGEIGQGPVEKAVSFHRLEGGAAEIVVGTDPAPSDPFDLRVGPGSGAEDRMSIALPGLVANLIGLTGRGLRSAANAVAALDALDAAHARVNGALVTIGSYANRLDAAMENARTAFQNTVAAESVIRDADVADEATQLVRRQITMEVSTALLAKANLASRSVLSLLN